MLNISCGSELEFIYDDFLEVEMCTVRNVTGSQITMLYIFRYRLPTGMVQSSEK